MENYKQFLDRAARLCSSTEKCSAEIRQKFLQWGMKEDEADRALQFLVQNQFIDDRRYAGFFVKDKIKINKWGRMKIRHALRQKGISEDIIKEALACINPEEYAQTLDSLIKSKIKSIGGLSNTANKAKLFRFALQRGFLHEEINEALRRIS